VVRVLDLESLPLERRATYRRVLAVLKAQPGSFVVAGSLGLSVHAGVVLDGELEVYVRPADLEGALEAVAHTGYRIERDGGRASLPDHHVRIAAVLPEPMGGQVDEAWFEHATRVWLLGLRVRVAPPEEILWLRIATKGAASLGDPLIVPLLANTAGELDWARLLQRLAGFEALLLAHLFLYWHQDPRSAREVIPAGLPAMLLERLDRLVTTSTGPPAGAG
jgi:hypothetical protein